MIKLRMGGKHVPGSRWPADVVEKIGAMWEAGCSGGIIAGALGLTRCQILGIVWRNGFERGGGVHRTLVSERKAAEASP